MLSGVVLGGIVRVDVFNALGSRVSHAERVVQPGERPVSSCLWQSPGLYYAKVQAGGDMWIVRCLLNGAGEGATLVVGSNPVGPVGKRAAAHTVVASKPGYITKQVVVAIETGNAGTIRLRGPVPVMKSLYSGTFTMGQPGLATVHQVTLSAFSIQETEVTQGRYLMAMGTNPSSFTGDLSRPVEQVSWYDAIRYCNALSKLSGLDTCYSYTDTGATDAVCDFTTRLMGLIRT
jgi:hypothetical protein